ncbi:hypothetical protein BBJ29_005179 [Phytophthora kernoviae]|uniref:PX domain-containing protein n=1 Tax=Phytophthora kernoviae TaxID=325452 RepID=A0A3F2RJ81_9STRA|nr:hypothetical protein BBJ29_005179 [Phytophthora kernoviae]RLN58298.1 hypothetical protein BBP00_00007068 [Phytophthora kernoviae]
MTTESTATMPMLQHLSSVKIEPTRSSKVSLCLVFLEKIDRIEINSTKEHDGVVYYVLDVFLKHSTSHIPTIKMTTASANGRQPDYQLERRFNDFANLRYEVWMHAQHRHVGPCTCAYCNAFMKYIELSISQPRLFVKLGADLGGVIEEEAAQQVLPQSKQLHVPAENCHLDPQVHLAAAYLKWWELRALIDVPNSASSSAPPPHYFTALGVE